MSETKRYEPKDDPIWQRVGRAIGTEFLGVHPRLHAYNVAARLLPLATPGEVRAHLLRFAGFAIGAGTRIQGPLSITGPRGLLSRLRVGADCSIGTNCVLDLSEHLTIGDRVTIEPGVMILTSTHELDIAAHRAGALIPSPVTIGDGAWLRARSIILPGVKIGRGAVVDAGAVVNKDVAANARVGGLPAVQLELLKADEG